MAHALAELRHGVVARPARKRFQIWAHTLYGLTPYMLTPYMGSLTPFTGFTVSGPIFTVSVVRY